MKKLITAFILIFLSVLGCHSPDYLRTYPDYDIPGTPWKVVDLKTKHAMDEDGGRLVCMGNIVGVLNHSNIYVPSDEIPPEMANYINEVLKASHFSQDEYPPELEFQFMDKSGFVVKTYWLWKVELEKVSNDDEELVCYHFQFNKLLSLSEYRQIRACKIID